MAKSSCCSRSGSRPDTRGARASSACVCPTDYGRTLADLKSDYLGLLDRHTRVIVVGDARNNGGDPRSEILRPVYQRCRRVVWLSPEPRSFCGSGDSEMRRYAPYCHVARVCNTIRHFRRVVDHVLPAQARR